MTSKTQRSLFLFISLIAAAFLTWWWSQQSTTPATQRSQTTATPRPEAPSPCETHLFDGSRFTVCAADPASTRARLILSGTSGKPLRSLAALKPITEASNNTPLFAMNAGMYDDEGEPIGLYVSGGTTHHTLNRKAGEGNFHLVPNGVFWVDAAGRYHVDTTTAFAESKPAPTPTEATQSGPMLVINGKLHPAFSPDGESRYRRNGVGIDAQGIAWFAISEEPVSFGKFARLFRDELDCPDALYFDGAVSSIWIPAENRLEIGPPIGPMILVEKR